MRLPVQPGECLDRDQRLTFTFESRTIAALGGDTIASALYAGGQRVFSRSFKYHRKRGLSCCTGSCANCLVNVDGEPSVRACMRPVRGGETVSAQIHAGSLERDPLTFLTRTTKPLTPVGFYYRMMTRPAWLWPHYERALRRLTGLGKVDAIPAREIPRYSAENRHVDVLVVGAGRSGRAAAERLVAEGREVMIIDERPEYAGLELPGAEVLAPARALGVYEGLLVPIEMGHLKIRAYARSIVVATGAIDQPPLFYGNDLVGVMSPSAAQRLIGLWAIRPGERAVIAAPADTAAGIADRLVASGVEIVDVVDVSGRGLSLSASGRHGMLESVSIDGRRRECDLLVATSGRQPAYSLLAQAGARIEFDDQRGVFVPRDLPAQVDVVGAAAGDVAPIADPAGGPSEGPLGAHCFVCPCEDVTTRDLGRAVREGFDSIEVLKRYTTITMGPCQGRLCQLASVRLLAASTDGDGQPAASTTARPPWSPVALGLIASRRRASGKRTAIHGRHRELGASMVWTGAWRRPDHFGDPTAEISALHGAVGMIDVSTLGRLLVDGAGAEEYLNRVFPGRISTLAVGRVRYVVFNTETGRMVDDGTVVRLGESTYLVTTSSGGSDAIYETFELWRERWRSAVNVVKLSSALGAIAISGPSARVLLGRSTPADVTNERLPYMGAVEDHVAGVPCLIIRIGFVGELGFELHFPSEYGGYLWDALLESGKELGIRPFGVEALKVLRLEKGHVIVGIDTDAESTMIECGFGRMIAWDKGEFVGRAALERMRDAPDGRRLVGFVGRELPREGTAVLVDGAVAGRVTSARWSAEAGQVIGLAYLPSSRALDGARFEFDAGDGRAAGANVHLSPFVDPQGDRLRG